MQIFPSGISVGILKRNVFNLVYYTVLMAAMLTFLLNTCVLFWFRNFRVISINTYLIQELERSDTEGISEDLTVVPSNSHHIIRALTCMEGERQAIEMKLAILNWVSDFSMFAPCMSIIFPSTSWSNPVHLLIQSNCIPTYFVVSHHHHRGR